MRRFEMIFTLDGTVRIDWTELHRKQIDSLDTDYRMDLMQMALNDQTVQRIHSENYQEKICRHPFHRSKTISLTNQ